jgi:NADP-dependent 3-hydroxy acid dehydrogenase YdfG
VQPTPGASSGIGEAIANILVAEGYKVYGTSRCGAQSGQYAFLMLALDITDDASVVAAAMKNADEPSVVADVVLQFINTCQCSLLNEFGWCKKIAD